jgi:hypothetical protein
MNRFLKYVRNAHPRLFRAMFPMLVGYYGDDTFRLLSKFITHDHWDCDNDAETVLALLFLRGKFDVLPKDVVKHLKAIEIASRDSLTGDALLQAVYMNRNFQVALARYRRFIVQEPGKVNLGDYVKIIADNNVAVMQTDEELRLFTRQRIARAAAECVEGMVWRGAPLYHTAEGLSGDDVVRIIAEECDKAPFPMVLELCALRHEARVPIFHDRAEKVADLCIRFPDHVGYMDFAADETSFHSREDYRWYLIDAVRAWAVRLAMGRPLVIDTHMGETVAVGDTERQMLDKIEALLRKIAFDFVKFASGGSDGYVGLVDGLESIFGSFSESEKPRFEAAEGEVRRLISERGFAVEVNGGKAMFFSVFLGHGINDLVSVRPRSVCVSSNMYLLPEIGSVDNHSIGQLFREGKPITLGPDGLDPLGIVDASQDYALLWHSKHAFRLPDFKRIAFTAVNTFNASPEKVAKARAAAVRFYGDE